MPGDSFTLRAATLADVPAIRALIEISAHGLSVGDYTREQIDGALRGAFGVDTQLLKDGSYFVAQSGAGTGTGTPLLAGCGGWSFRRTLFGGDARTDRDPQPLDPQVDAAKIRAFFVHPDWARRGIGRSIMATCEQAIAQAGFRKVDIVATLVGEPLYASFGYAVVERYEIPMRGGLSLPVVRMTKDMCSEHRKDR